MLLTSIHVENVQKLLCQDDTRVHYLDKVETQIVLLVLCN